MADNAQSSQNKNQSAGDNEPFERQRQKAVEELEGELGGESEVTPGEEQKQKRGEPVNESLVEDVEAQLSSSLGTGEQKAPRQEPQGAQATPQKEGQTTPGQRAAAQKRSKRSPKKPPSARKQPSRNATGRGREVSNVPAGASKPDAQQGAPSGEPSTLPRLRTYKDDAAAAMQREKSSLSSIAAAEQDRQYEEQKQSAHAAKKATSLGLLSKKLWIRVGIGTGIFVLLAGGGASIYIFGESLPGLGFIPGLGGEEQQQFDVQPPELIPSNVQQEVVLSGDNTGEKLHRELLTLSEELSLSLGNIANVFFTQSAAGGKRVVGAQTFFNRLGAEVPAALNRGTQETFMFGFHAFDGRQPFLILQPTSFETAFSGMLDWEERMNEDLAPLFGPEVERFVGTTTEGSLERRRFADRVIDNQDVRVLENADDEAVLMYAFPRRDRLVITTNRNTLNEVLRRMRTTRVVQ